MCLFVGSALPYFSPKTLRFISRYPEANSQWIGSFQPIDVIDESKTVYPSAVEPESQFRPK